MSGDLPKRKLEVGQYVEVRYDGRIHRVDLLDEKGNALVRPMYENKARWVGRNQLTILVEHAPA